MGTGLRRPASAALGLDAAGVVEAVGPGVTRVRPGDRVFGDLTQFGYGAFAEYACAPERAWAVLPPNVTFEVAATVPQSGIIALQGLRGGHAIKPGSHVLVVGASGNVGPFAVQLAKSFGAEVTGVCSTRKMDLVRSLGADHVIDYSREDYTKGGARYDWILDVWARRSFLAPRKALRPGGRYVMVGGSTGAILEGLLLGPILSLARNRTIGLALWWKPFDLDDVAVLSRLLAAGVLAPVIDRRFPLEGVPDALRSLAAGKPAGKLVITVVEPA
jgi:NADPH:quinone reductase-like Zn-dependent oxidoreductase